MDLQQANNAIKTGAIVAFLSAGLNTAFVLYAILSETEGTFSFFADPSIFLDVFLIASAGIALLRNSRVAAIFLALFHIYNQVVLRLLQPELFTFSTTSITVAILILIAYATAVKATFRYHSLMLETDPDFKSTTTISKILGTAALGLLGLFVIYAVYVYQASWISTEVLSQSEIIEHHIELLMNNDIVQQDEEILFFYPHNPDNLLESGNVLTDSRVILYYEEEDYIYTYHLLISEVGDVIQELKGSRIELSQYMVTGNQPDEWIRLFLSNINNGDASFVNQLLSMIGKE